MLGWSESKVSRLETARIGLTMAGAVEFVEALGVEGEERENLLALAEDAANTRGWWHAYRSVITTEQRMVADVEAGATHIRHYASVLLPGLLQTPAYTRHTLAWQEDLGVGHSEMEAAVKIRGERQRVLRDHSQLRYDVVLDEAVVRRQIAPEPVLRTQVERLIAVAHLANVRLRILPLEAITEHPRPPAAHTFQIIDFRDAEDPSVVAVESLVDLRYFTDMRHIESYRVLFERCWQAALHEGATLEWLAAL
jgi:hypothetical protein